MKINKKNIFKLLGIIFMVIGSIGLFLPILPTTPFVLVSAYFFYNSSPKLFMYLISNKYFGLSLYIYIKYRSIELRAKLISLIFLWTSGSISMYFITISSVKIMMIIIFIIVTIHILSFPTLSNKDKRTATADYRMRYRK